jgi:hypothetical protein
MLEADIVAPQPTRLRSSTVDSISSPIASRLEGNGLISYYDFLGYYWGHFSQSLTKNLGMSRYFWLLSHLIEGQIQRSYTASFSESSRDLNKL